MLTPNQRLASTFERTTDASGFFIADGLREGWVQVTATAEGFAPSVRLAEVLAGLETSLEITLQRPAGIAGTVHTTAGEPVGDASVRAERLQATGERLLLATARSNPNGSYALDNLEPGTYVLLAQSPEHGEDVLEVELAAASSHRWDPVLHPALSIRGRVVRASGAPASGMTVEASSRHLDQPWKESVVADDEGSFLFADCIDLPLTLHVRDEAGRALATMHDVPPATSPTPIRIELPPVEDPVEVSGHLVRIDGSVPADSQLLLFGASGDTLSSHAFDSSTGAFRFDAVLPNSYLVHALLPSTGLTFVREIDVPAGQPLDLGTLEVPLEGYLTAETSSAGPASERRFLVVDARGRGFATVGDFTGAIPERQALLAGSYHVVLDSDSEEMPMQTVLIEAGQVTRVSLPIERK